MGHLLEAIDQAKLDEQRAVVKNEMRQGLNQPYGKAYRLTYTAGVPYGHPYHHPVIGSKEDLDAATLDDVKAWFKDYYGPSNAVIVLSGDITPKEARERVEKYFGNIPAGKPVAALTRWPVRMDAPVREVIEDEVSHPRLFKVWNAPAHTDEDLAYLKVLATILGGDNNSRLYKRLVVEDALATDVSAFVGVRELGSQFHIDVTAKTDADRDRVEEIVDEELTLLNTFGPTGEELAYVRSSELSALARNLESLSFKAELLNDSVTFYGRPDGWQEEVSAFKSADIADIKRVGQAWLSGPDYTLWALPFGDYSVSGKEADRSAMPMPQGMVAGRFPATETTTLDNGLELVVAHRDGAPIVDFTMLFETGPEASWKQTLPGTGQAVVKLLANGTDKMSREEINQRLGLLGANLETDGSDSQSQISLSAMKSGVAESLAVYADVIMHPSFPPDEIARIRALALDELAQVKDDPFDAVNRLTPAAVLGHANPYGRLATEASIEGTDRSAIEQFHDTWYRPNNAKLIVTGDTNLSEVQPLVEEAFRTWSNQPVPDIIVPEEANPAKAMVYLVDRPGAVQSMIRATVTAPAFSEKDEEARIIFNSVIGGDFVSRVNMKLREEKGWSYGAWSGFGGPEGGRLFSTTAPVQSDKTADAMSEMAAILQGVISDQPVADNEVKEAREQEILSLPGLWSSNQGISSYIAYRLQNDLPDDFYDDYAEKLAGVDTSAVNKAAQAMLGDKPLTWIVIGDRARIEDDIEALELGDLHIIDADGNPVQ